MRTIRPIEVETCCICGEQFDKIKMRDFFVGRQTIWMCPACYAGGNRQLDARRAAWKNSAKGKDVITKAEKKK